jgi:hypothetical protein
MELGPGGDQLSPMRRGCALARFGFRRFLGWFGFAATAVNFVGAVIVPALASGHTAVLRRF